MRVYRCKLFMGHDSHVSHVQLTPSIGVRLIPSIDVPLLKSVDTNVNCRSSDVSLLKLFLLYHLPKIILYDCIHVVLQCFISFTLDEGLLFLNSFSCLNHLCLKLLHMCSQSLKLFIQLSVDIIYLPIDIHHQLLLALKNLINHCFYLAISSLW